VNIRIWEFVHQVATNEISLDELPEMLLKLLEDEDVVDATKTYRGFYLPRGAAAEGRPLTRILYILQ
jgi:hypothetical protein